MPNNEERRQFRCSFCGKTEEQVKKLIEGPGVYICNECVELCLELFEDDIDIVENDSTEIEEQILSNNKNLESAYSKKINCKSLNICCTHNHAGFDTVGYWGKLPKTGKNPAYMDKLLNSIVTVSKEEISSLFDWYSKKYL